MVVTRAHAFDVDCLKVILRKPAAYVGMMGSRGRAALVRRQLLEAGIDAERVEALYAPIGLSISSQTAEEIALSILAQIVSIKNARPQTEGFSSALLEAMAQTDAAGQQAVLAVIAARHGSTPREIGDKNAGSHRRLYCGQRGRRYYGAPHHSGCTGNADGSGSGVSTAAFFGRRQK